MPSQHWLFGSGSGYPGIPAGGILGTIGTIPAGFSSYTSLTGRLILGSTTAGSSGGSSTVRDATSSSDGLHSSGDANVFERTSSGGGSQAPGAIYSAGAHSHSVTFSYTPPRARVVLMKCDADDTEVPVNSVFFGIVTNLTDYDRAYDSFNNSGYYLEHSTSVGLSGSSGSVSSGSNSFSHRHHNYAYTGTAICAGWVPSNGGFNPPYAGPSHSHGHSGASVSGNVPYVNMRAFYRLTASKKLGDGMIILFDGATIPDGWVICDGTNSTPNTISKFARMTAYDLGVVGGNNSCSGSVTLTSAGSHNHPISYNTTGWACAYGHSGYVSHTHSSSFGSTYWPYYRTLKFIQYVG